MTLQKRMYIVYGLIFVLFLVDIAGCARNERPVTIPMPTVFHENPACEQCGRLIVFLPGKGDVPESFVRGGFIEDVIARKVPFDMLVVDAHLGYYLKADILKRLEQDVIRPAREKGYREIWFVAISMGAIGSIGYIDTHPDDDIAGAVLLGPYLGESSITDEIIEAGGLHNWEPGALQDNDWQRKMWSFLKGYVGERPPAPPIIIAYGEHDRFSTGAKLLAASLPPGMVVTNTGRHTWPAWRALWDVILEKPLFAKHGAD